ncbi:MAG TPA: Fe-S cluster assembly protein SufD [Anaerolineales bacterium]|nr:Fe-S cluster assembly protein SufD [Anaerolineales bacterium]
MADKVVRRVRRVEETGGRDFSFTREMVSAAVDGRAPSFLREYRNMAWEAFERLPMPVTTDEPWRRTDLRGMKAGAFRLPEVEMVRRFPDPPPELLQPLVGGDHGSQMVLLPGDVVEAKMDPEVMAKGVVFTDLITAEREHPEVLAKALGSLVRPDEGKFAALAGAMARTGVLVYVPRGVELEQPLHSVIWGPGSGLAYFSHVLVWLEEGSSLTYIHEAASPTEAQGQTLHCGIVEIHVGPAANFRFVELQSWGEHVWNFSHERARVERDANLDWIFGAVGSRLTKNFSDLDLTGVGASGRMSGFYFTDGIQHLDHDTQQNHLAPHTTSDLLFKGALKDRSRSVWQGMIYVAPGAQKTDGYQANRNLTLSPQARADSIPGLEILADDVRCTHGATVGKIDPDHLFYLQSRGIPRKVAERLIVEGFFDPIMQRIPFEGVRERFQTAIREKML